MGNANPVKLFEIYSGGGQYYATVLLAVVFAQFSDLTLLQGKFQIQSSKIANVSAIWPAILAIFPISFLVLIYILILLAGIYFVHMARRFASLLDHIAFHTPSNATLRRFTKERKQPRYRKFVIQHEILVLFIYGLLSILALPAVFLA